MTLLLIFKRVSNISTRSQHLSSSSLPFVPNMLIPTMTKNVPVLLNYFTHSSLLSAMIPGQLSLWDQNRLLQWQTPLPSRVLLLKTDIRRCLMFHVSLSPPNNDEIMFEDKQGVKGTLSLNGSCTFCWNADLHKFRQMYKGNFSVRWFWCKAVKPSLFSAVLRSIWIPHHYR